MSKWDRPDISVNKILHAAYKSGVVRDAEGSVHQMRDVTSPEEGRHLYDLVHDNKYSHTLEIGLAMGASAVWIAQAHADNAAADKSESRGSHVAIDPNQNTQYSGLGLKLVRDAGLTGYVTHIAKPSGAALPEILQEVLAGSRPKFNLVYIDGWHTFDFTLIDFFYSDKILEPGGCIVIDDVRHGGVKKCVKFILANYDHYTVLDSGLSTNITLVKTREDDRPQHSHKNF